MDNSVQVFNYFQSEYLSWEGGVVLLYVFGILCIICFFDYSQKRIPNFLLIGLFLIWVASMWSRQDFSGFLVSCLDMAMVFLLFYPMFTRRMLGAGDVKLLVLCTGLLNHGEVLDFFFISFLFAAVVSLIKLVLQRQIFERMKYLAAYVRKAVLTRQLPVYFEEDKQLLSASVRLAGPIVLGMLYVYGRRGL